MGGALGSVPVTEEVEILSMTSCWTALALLPSICTSTLDAFAYSDGISNRSPKDLRFVAMRTAGNPGALTLTASLTPPVRLSQRLTADLFPPPPPTPHPR